MTHLRVKGTLAQSQHSSKCSTSSGCSVVVNDLWHFGQYSISLSNGLTAGLLPREFKTFVSCCSDSGGTLKSTGLGDNRSLAVSDSLEYEEMEDGQREVNSK